MSKEAAAEFLKKLEADEALIKEVRSRGSNRAERIAAIAEFGGGKFTREDVESVFNEERLPQESGTELNDADLEQVAGGSLRFIVGKLWSYLNGGGPDSGGSTAGTGVRG